MTGTIFCKVCLNMNVKMYELRAYALEDCYKSIVGNISEDNIVNSMLHTCYECTYLIYKYHSFRRKCLQGLSILQEIIENNATITSQDIASVDRDNLKLSSNLKPECSSLYYNYIEHENLHIKEECNVNDHSDIIDNNILSVYEVKVENDVKRRDPSGLEFGNNQVFAGPLETTKIILTEIKIENDLTKNEDVLALEYGDDQVFAMPLKRRKIQKIKKTVANTSVVKTQKHPPRKQSMKEKSSRSLNDSTSTPLHDSVKKIKNMKRKFQESKNSTKKQKSTYCSELTPEEKNMKGILTVKILTLEEQLNNLLERKKSSNYINSHYKCDLCYKGFMDSNTYNRHMAKHDPANGPFKCPVCKTMFQKERLVRHHSKLHNRNYICNTCSHTCNNWPQAKQHQNEHIGKVYSCKHCEYITSKRSSHLSHVKLKHATGFVCNLCGFTFVSELGLSQHTTMMHGIKMASKIQESSDKKQEPKTTEEHPHSKPGRYCDVCNVSCNSFQKWKRHVASSKHIYRLNGGSCGECEETFTSREDLRLHYRRIHLKQETHHEESTARQGNPFLPKTWPAKCLHCNEELSDARQYYWHFRKAHPNEEYPVQKDYICDICGKLFGFNSTLVQHRRKHLNDGLYNCMQCSKTFVDKVQLVHHEKIHADDRPFTCEVCCKTFKFKTALKKHVKCHSK